MLYNNRLFLNKRHRSGGRATGFFNFYLIYVPRKENNTDDDNGKKNNTNVDDTAKVVWTE